MDPYKYIKNRIPGLAIYPIVESGKEYFRQLNRVLKNQDDLPDAIKDLQKQLGIEVGIGFKGGGLAKILEV